MGDQRRAFPNSRRATRDHARDGAIRDTWTPNQWAHEQVANKARLTLGLGARASAFDLDSTAHFEVCCRCMLPASSWCDHCKGTYTFRSALTGAAKSGRPLCRDCEHTHRQCATCANTPGGFTLCKVCNAPATYQCGGCTALNIPPWY